MEGVLFRQLAWTILFCSLGFALGCGQSSFNLATERQEILFISDSREVAIGRSLVKAVESKFKVCADPKLTDWVDAIGQRLAKVSDRRDIPYRFRVLEEEDFNAFALPGGFVYINKGTIDALENREDALACVLAHEIAHVAAKHSVKRLQSAAGYGVLQALLGIGVSDADLHQGLQVGFESVFLAYSREDELAADTLAVKYLRAAGYPSETICFVLENLWDWQSEQPLRTKNYFRTHPYIRDRLGAVREELHGQIQFEDYINRTLE